MAERTEEERDGGTARSVGWRGGLGCLAAVGVLLAIEGAIAWAFLNPMGHWPGSAMTTAWTARSDTDGTPSEGAPDRTWLIGDTVVRGGSEGVRAFGAATGDAEERAFRDLEDPAREVLPYGDLLIAVQPVGDRYLSVYEPW